MEREKIIELMKSANIPVGKAEVGWWELVDGVPTQIARLIALVEKETLEMAAEKLESQHVWITNTAASALIRELKI